MFKITDDNLSMDDLLVDSVEYAKPELGSVITGKVISVKKNRLVVDLNGVAVGMVSGVETHDSAGTINDLVEGDEVKAVVVEEEDDNGMVVLSLKKASQSIAWDRFEELYKTGDITPVTINEANKGGLLMDIDGIKGFIPVSQLAPVHYPRVEGANASQILTRLQKLIGEKLDVKVINIDRSTGKMILSEKAAIQVASKATLDKLEIGNKVKGRVSGVVKFGVFVTFNGLEGLVHISEIAWGHVSNPHQYAKVGDTVEVEIIGIEGGKLSLSMKRLVSDPWSKIEEKYSIGTKVKGTINRFSAFGAFVQLEDDINGLIHLSEISNQKVEDPSEFLTIGEEVEAQVINIDRDEHRIGLSIKATTKKAKKEPARTGTGGEVKEDKAEEKAEEKEEKKPKKVAAKKTTKKEEAKEDKEEVKEESSSAEATQDKEEEKK